METAMSSGNSVKIGRLYYTFPVGDFKVTAVLVFVQTTRPCTPAMPRTIL